MLREIRKENFNERFIPTYDYFDKRNKNKKNVDIDLWAIIQRGLYNEIQNNEKVFILIM